MVASSTSSAGRPSRTGYTRPQEVHLNSSGFVLTSKSPLQAGQTTRSRRSWGIIIGGLYDDSNAFSPQIHKDTEQGNNITIIASHFARTTKYLPKGILLGLSLYLCVSVVNDFPRFRIGLEQWGD